MRGSSGQESGRGSPALFPAAAPKTHLRAKGKLIADAAEKFRGLSKGLLPAEEEVGKLSQQRPKQDSASPSVALGLTGWDRERRQGPGKSR